MSITIMQHHNFAATDSFLIGAGMWTISKFRPRPRPCAAKVAGLSYNVLESAFEPVESNKDDESIDEYRGAKHRKQVKDHLQGRLDFQVVRVIRQNLPVDTY